MNLANSSPEGTQQERPRWVYCTLLTFKVSCLYNISRRGLSRVAYPGQGNARAHTRDKREVELPTSFAFKIATTNELPNSGSYRRKEQNAYGQNNEE